MCKGDGWQVIWDPAGILCYSRTSVWRRLKSWKGLSGEFDVSSQRDSTAEELKVDKASRPPGQMTLFWNCNLFFKTTQFTSAGPNVSLLSANDALTVHPPLATCLYETNTERNKVKDTVPPGCEPVCWCVGLSQRRWRRGAYPVGEGLGVEVDRVDVHILPHAQEVPVHRLPLCHHQPSQVPIREAVYSCHTQLNSIRFNSIVFV